MIRTVSLYADFGHEWPLWEYDDSQDQPVITTSPEDYGLSAELTQKIRSWHDFWLAHYDPETFWDSSANHAEWWTRGKTIAALLRSELRGVADVKFL